jgi:chromosome segregation ATPase
MKRIVLGRKAIMPFIRHAVALPMLASAVLLSACTLIGIQKDIGTRQAHVSQLTEEQQRLRDENRALVAEREELTRQQVQGDLDAAQLDEQLGRLQAANEQAITHNKAQADQKARIDQQVRALRAQTQALVARNKAVAISEAAKRQQISDLNDQTRKLLLITGEMNGYAPAPAAAR